MTIRPIILAEHNEELRRNYARILEACGFPVAQARDGEIAVGLLHEIASPQLIILDVVMPHLDGIEACKRIRTMHGVKDLCPIIFLTIQDNPQMMLDCLRAGGDDVLKKSSPVAEITQRVQFWSRRGAYADLGGRRERAIKELELTCEGRR